MFFLNLKKTKDTYSRTLRSAVNSPSGSDAGDAKLRSFCCCKQNLSTCLLGRKQWRRPHSPTGFWLWGSHPMEWAPMVGSHKGDTPMPQYATDIQTKGSSFKFTRNQNPLCYKAACRFVIRHTTTLTAYMHATENVCCHIQNENIFHTAVILRDSVNNVKITIIC